MAFRGSAVVGMISYPPLVLNSSMRSWFEEMRVNSSTFFGARDDLFFVTKFPPDDDNDDNDDIYGADDNIDYCDYDNDDDLMITMMMMKFHLC